MDNKRPHKYCAVKQLCSILCILFLTSCTWVKDDNDDCPYGFWLNLHYTYNILDVEAAPEYVKDVSVYIYDSIGNYVSRLDVPQTLLAANGHKVRIEGLQEGDYKFVVWSGVSNSQYAVSGDRTTMDNFRLSLAGSSTTVTTRLPDLYYGLLSTVHYDDAYAVHDVWMMKDTNQLTCLFVPLSGDTKVDPADYDLEVVSDNGTMNVLNIPVSATPITYQPFERDTVTVDDSEYGKLHGLGFSLTTLRLMKDLDCRLVFQKADTGATIFDISLPEFIGMIGSYYTNLGRPLTLQEYLDRQDFYNIIFFLSDDFSQLIRLDVNSWRLRDKNHLKL